MDDQASDILYMLFPWNTREIKTLHILESVNAQVDYVDGLVQERHNSSSLAMEFSFLH